MAGIARLLNEPRIARSELEHGHPTRAVVDTAIAAADLELGRSVIGGIRRGPFKLSGSHTASATRKWLGKKGLAAKGQHAHHWLVPNGGWGRAVPAAIKNQPWNYKMTDSPLHHVRIHSQSLKFDLPRFNHFERYVHGTPRWWKAANASAVAHAAAPVGHELIKFGHFVGGHLPGRHQNSVGRPRNGAGS